MSDFILIEGDEVVFHAAFGAATVVVKPGALTASGEATAAGKVCVAGDEGDVAVEGCAYTFGSYTNGVGTLKIAALAADQVATKTKSGGAKVLLVGGVFTAKFEVKTPAQMVTPSGVTQTDANTEYAGTGNFVTANRKVRGT